MGLTFAPKRIAWLLQQIVSVAGTMLLATYILPGVLVGQTEAYKQLIWSKAQKHEVDPHLLMAIVEAESRGDPDAISWKDCRGLAQLSIYTARMYDPFLIRMDLHDPEINLEVAAKHIRYLERMVAQQFPSAEQHRRVVLIAAAFNAGWSAVERAGGVPDYAETRQYVKEVLNYYLKFK